MFAVEKMFAGPPAQAGGPARRRLGLAEMAPPNSSFSTGFIRFFDMAECHVRFIYKPNAFLIILESILRFWLQNHQNSTGFIRYVDQLFWMLQNVVLLMDF